MVCTTLVQDGSYLEMLGLKLSEAVSKALAQPIVPTTIPGLVASKRPIPPGRGRALGALIASEFSATQDSPHLHRAILRSLQRPLSVLLTNLSTNLLPLLSSPAFHSVPAPSNQNPNPTPPQMHALAIVTFVDELLEVFDDLDLGKDADPRGDGLKFIRDGLVSLVNRVVTPLIAIIHKEMVMIIEALETPASRLGAKTHPSLITLQANLSVYSKALTRYTSSVTSQATLATFLISIVWRGLLALAHRPHSLPSPPVSPRPASSSTEKTSATPVTSPSRFTTKLPPSRPSSPPRQSNPCSADAKTLFDLLNVLPRPRVDKECNQLAGEAVEDAFDGLKSLSPLLDAVHSSYSRSDSKDVLKELALKFQGLTTSLPLLIAIAVLLQAPVPGRSITISVGELLGIKEAQYRNECLSGFGRAEECATTVASRVLSALRSNSDVNPVVCTWLEMEIADTLEN